MDWSTHNIAITPASLGKIEDPQYRSSAGYNINDRSATSVSNGLIHQEFERQAELTPNSVAVCTDSQSLTYTQLNQSANQLAHALLTCGIEPDDRVAVYAARSLETIVALLGVLKAGGAYVPLDPGYPGDRLGFMLMDSAPRAVLTITSLVNKLSSFKGPIILLDKELKQPTRNPTLPYLTPRHLAYVVYTSGSSGVPKGVMIEHRSVLRLVINTSYARIGPNDCVAHSASPSFDAVTWEIWAPLLNGGRVLIVPPCVVLSPAEFNRTLVAHRVTGMWLTVGLFNEYVDAMESAFSGLDHLLIGGDALNPYYVARALQKQLVPRRLLNGYGPTETTTFASTFLIRSMEVGATTVPIGRPISDTSIYILDEDGVPVEVGATGELYIGGTGVARGYLNQPRMTAERFVPDRFSDIPGARLYRTGDLGCWRTDENIEYLGRNDSQVKIRGFRVEPGEVEAALKSHPEVRQAVVVARKDESGMKSLIGYVVADSQQFEGLTWNAPLGVSLRRDLASRLRGYLTGRLPPYMLPASISLLQEFPLTANGKVDRRALPAPECSSHSSQPYAPARTTIEAMLVALWKDVLHIDQPGIDDNFFESGGNSLTGMRLASMASDRTNVSVSFTMILKYSSIRTLAETIGKQQSHRSSPTAESAYPVKVETPCGTLRAGSSRRVPITLQQESFLAFGKRHQDWSFWVTAELRLTGTLDYAALRRSLELLLWRHESLRTRIVAIDGALYQEIDEPTELRLDIVNLLADTSGSAELKAKCYLDSLFCQRVDLATGPLSNFWLLQLAESEHVLAVAIHHIMVDGAGIVTFFRELWETYREMLHGRQLLPHVATRQYPDYATWQKCDVSQLRERREAHWSARLSGADILRMPCGVCMPDITPYSTAQMQISFGETVSAALQELARSERTTSSIVVATLFAVTMARWCGQDDFVLPFGFSGRDRDSQFDVIGLFATTLLLRITLTRGDTFLDVLERVDREFLSACENFDFGIHCNEVTGLQRSSTIQWVPWHHDELNGIPSSVDGADPIPALSVKAFRERSLLKEDGMPESFEMERDMLWHFTNAPEGIVGRGYYRADLYTEDYIQRLMRSFRQIAEQIVRDPGVHLAELPNERPGATEFSACGLPRSGPIASRAMRTT